MNPDKAKKIIRTWNGNYLPFAKDTLFVKKLKILMPALLVAEVLLLIDNTCNDCWDSDSNCQCWNDK